MAGNTIGNLFKVTTFGESHGDVIGVVIDGMPANITISLDDLCSQLQRRAPGQIPGTTNRRESDKPVILSGIFEGKTLGTPICVIIQNQNQNSSEYDKLKNEYRPGHADKTTMLKYGIRDHRGGGRSSGRETASRVIAGYFASLVLPKEVSVKAYATQIGKIKSHIQKLNNHQLDLGLYSFIETERSDEIQTYLLDLKQQGNSVGGKVSAEILNCPIGLGEPVFDKIKADFAKALLSIGACTSFSYGLGEEFSEFDGTQVTSNRENFSGMEGGITNGDPIFLSMTFRPTSTVGLRAKEGRHDPCIIPRVIPVVESMIKIILADHFLRQKIYEK